MSGTVLGAGDAVMKRDPALLGHCNRGEVKQLLTALSNYNCYKFCEEVGVF